MQAKQRTLTLNWFYTMLLMLIGSVFVVSTTFYLYFSLQSVISEQFYRFYVEEKKADVEMVVNNWIDEIEYDSQLLRDEINAETKYRIDNLTKHLSELNYAIDDRDMVILEAEKYFAMDPKYLYFIIDSEGKMMRSGTDERIVGIDMIDVQDPTGKFFFREMLEATERPEGMYISYMWPKEQEGEPLLKTSFIKYIEKYDLIIGTGAYEEDIIESLKKDTYQHIQQFYEGEEDYVFIVTNDGIAKVFGNPDIVGESVTGIIDKNGERLHDAFLEAIEEKGYGYNTYYYNKKDSTETSEKISYIRRIDGWGVYMGQGFHTDDVRAVIAEYADIVNYRSGIVTAILIAVMVLLGIAMMLLMRRGMRLQKLILKNEELLFEHLFNLINEAVVITTEEGLVWYLNSPASKLFGDEVTALNPMTSVGFEKLDNDTYKYVSLSSRVYYLDIEVDPVVYHNTDGLIYFVKDVTDFYIETNKLEYMALYDALTALPNRRKLLNDLEDLCQNRHEYNKVVLGLLDLDFFKNINDTYGHSVGDEVLQLLGETFNENCRATDVFYRYGGEEFFIIMKGIDAVKAKEILENIKLIFTSQTSLKFNFEVTFSTGLLEVDCSRSDFSDFDALFRRSDKLLYKAKENGRNCIMADVFE